MKDIIFEVVFSIIWVLFVIVIAGFIFFVIINLADHEGFMKFMQKTSEYFGGVK